MNISLPNGSSRNIISGNGFIPCCCFWSVTFFSTELHQTTSGYKNRVRIQAPRVVSIIAGKPKTASFPYENWRPCLFRKVFSLFIAVHFLHYFTNCNCIMLIHAPEYMAMYSRIGSADWAYESSGGQTGPH